MNNSENIERTPRRPLRLWPGVVIVILFLVLRYIVPAIKPEALFIGVMAGGVAGLLIVVWWLFLSRAPWSERIGAVLLMLIALFATSKIIHVSIAKGAMGMLFPILAIPVLGIAFVAWAVLTSRLSDKTRRVTMVATILLACGFWALLRTGGFTGDFKNEFAWRWSQTPEERLLAQAKDEPVTSPSTSKELKTPEKQLPTQTENTPPQSTMSAGTTLEEQPIIEPSLAQSAPLAASAKAEAVANWPGFRGPERDSIVHGVQIKTDWSASPPVELWRRAIGPGWSSFAVQGNRLYTQEQRGDDEAVSCYNTTTGEVVWRHRDAARFWESNAGAGPRGTPTINSGRVYTLGATGILNVLNAADGSVVWSRNAATDTGTEIPSWGFSSSPLVVDHLVIVATAGQLIAYDVATSDQRWIGPKGGTDYSSPHLVNIDGVPQILLLCNPGVISVAPNSGEVLWQYTLQQGTRIVQPAVTADGDLLLSEGDQRGLRRVAVTHGSNKWTIKERWTSNGMKPYFSDFVVQDGHAFGFDGSYLSCMDLKDGKRKWKGGKYGSGQLVLLADQKLLLVLSEQGELALVSATPDQFTEIARFPAIKGKTWNHPALVNDILLVRNGEEMAAFRLAEASR
jgi:outer membrane protein assembly factor BamB